MNLSDFPGFPGFLSSKVASSHPDKIRVQKPELQEDDLETEIKDVIEHLRKIETPEYRAKLSKENMESKRRMYTFIFKNLLMKKEKVKSTDCKESQ